MNAENLLALIADLYGQLTALQQQNAQLTQALTEATKATDQPAT